MAQWASKTEVAKPTSLTQSMQPHDKCPILETHCKITKTESAITNLYKRWLKGRQSLKWPSKLLLNRTCNLTTGVQDYKRTAT